MPALPFCHVHLKARKPESRAYPKELKTIGDHIRKRRLDLHLFQRDVAEQIGVTESCIWNWESNTSTPELRCLSMIIRFLGYDPLPQPTSLVEQLLHFRRSRSMSQNALAKLIGVNPATLARWERGERQPMGVRLERVKSFLKTVKPQVKA